MRLAFTEKKQERKANRQYCDKPFTTEGVVYQKSAVLTYKESQTEVFKPREFFPCGDELSVTILGVSIDHNHRGYVVKIRHDGNNLITVMGQTQLEVFENMCDFMCATQWCHHWNMTIVAAAKHFIDLVLENVDYNICVRGRAPDSNYQDRGFCWISVWIEQTGGAPYTVFSDWKSCSEKRKEFRQLVEGVRYDMYHVHSDGKLTDITPIIED